MTVKESDSFKPKLGISACLLGQHVRYDGTHKRDSFLTETFGRFVEWVAICPEVEVGMGVPRETLRLVGTPDESKLIAERSGKDWTDAMQRFAAVRTRQLVELKLAGYVFKQNSPSCGVERVRVYGAKNMPACRGRGLFAAAVMARFPLIPVEEEGRLNDPALRENFIDRVFAYHRWQESLAGSKSTAALVEFHTRHKFLLLAHSEPHYRRLGHLVAAAGKITLGAALRTYGRVFMEALALQASVNKHANVLEHMAGHCSERLTAAERRELVELIHDYRKQLLPLIAPITLIKHYVKKYRLDYLENQIYLAPSPQELMRNHT